MYDITIFKVFNYTNLLSAPLKKFNVEQYTDFLNYHKNISFRLFKRYFSLMTCRKGIFLNKFWIN